MKFQFGARHQTLLPHVQITDLGIRKSDDIAHSLFSVFN